MGLKKLDKLLLVSFWPPFIATFFIALFVLVMQSLFLALDDIAGKGVSFFFILEMLGYMSVALFPMALPIAILISTVMVFGNLGESYELSSIKSAGVSLLRAMRPIIYVGFLITVFSYVSSDIISPRATLQFKSRLYDLQHQKPTLSLTEGVFNDDFNGYSIRIGSKNEKTGVLKDVLLVDFTDANIGSMMEVLAEDGLMQVTADGRYLIMELYNGWQYNKDGRNNKGMPFTRTSFEKFRKVFDLGQFDLDQTDQDLFRDHHSMLSVGDLIDKVDTTEFAILKRKGSLSETLKGTVFRLKAKKKESLNADGTPKTQENTEHNKRLADKSDHKKSADSQADKKVVSSSSKRGKKKSRISPIKKYEDLRQNMDAINEIPYAYTFKDEEAEKVLLKAKTMIRSANSQVKAGEKQVGRRRDKLVDYEFQLHHKFCLALACFVFVFIGVPMGAIVQKGGFGYPLLVSITFFILFNMAIIYGKKIAEKFVVDVVFAAWLPCVVMIPFCFLLTWMAMNDRKINVNLKGLWSRLTERFKKV
jgi:lipopolysaccharide export system permease protein